MQIMDKIEKIHDATLFILKNVGVVFHNDKAVEIFKNAGAKVDGSRVFLCRELIEKALESCPERISLLTRNNKLNVCIGTDQKYCAPITGALYINDIEKGRRLASSSDYINFVKLAQSSDMFQIIGGPIVIPRDIDENAHAAFITASILALTDKVALGQASDCYSARESIRMARLIFGNSKDCFILGMTNVITPLVYDNNSIEAIFEYVNEGQPIAIACCGIAGVTSPVTISGSIAVNNAEVLAGIVLTQLIKPGAPVIYGNISVAGDMRTGSLAAGAVESALITKGAAEMARYYKLPCRAGGNLTNAINCDIQAGYESMMSLMSAFTSPAHIIAQSAGMLESFMTASYEKFIIDEEIFNMAKRYINGFEVDDDHLALEAITEAGPGGNFLGSMHTFENYKTELLGALVSNRDCYDNWAVESKGIEESANYIWKKRLDDYCIPENTGNIEPLLEYWTEHYGEIPSALKNAINRKEV